MQVVVLVILIISAIVISGNYTKGKKQSKKTLSAISLPSKNPTPVISNTPILILSPSKIYNSTTPIVQNFSDLKYPSSRQLESSDTSFVFESNDDPDLITNWYKEKIKSLGMNSKSFVQTKTNGNVLNKLVGARGDKEIRVGIVKKNDESVTKITVSTTIPIDNQKTF